VLALARRLRRRLMFESTARVISRPSPAVATPVALLAPEALEPRKLLSATLLKDINISGVGSDPGGFTEYEGALYFAATGPQGRELYRSDAPGLVPALFKDLAPGSADSNPTDLTVVGDKLYFSTDGPGGTIDLWKTDGTDAGTMRVTGLGPPPGFDGIHLTDFNGVAFFTANAPGHGPVLFKSDGTAAGTVMVFDPDETSDTVGVTAIAAAGDTLYFTGRFDANHPGRLFATDGTAAGTHELVSFINVSPANLTPFGDRLLFAGFNLDPAENTVELWSSDGTPQGTQVLYPARYPHDITVVGDLAYFVSGATLYKTDGTTAGTQRLGDITIPEATINEMAGMGGNVYVVGGDAFGAALWRSDGTPAGTVRVKAVPAGELTVAGDTLFFIGEEGLWTSDGTTAGTNLLKPLTSPGGLTLAPFGDGVVFGNWEVPEGAEPWYSDGTADGTRRLADLNPSTRNSTPFLQRTAYPVSVNGRVVSAADDGATLPVVDLWSTDGTPGGTVKLVDFQRVDAIAAMNGFAYVLATDPLSRPGLWRTDGTPQGTTRVADVNYQLPVSFVPGWNGLVQVNGVLYFSADNPAGSPQRFGTEVWRSDGTTAGTYRVTDIRTGPASSDPRFLTAVGPDLYFSVAQNVWKVGATGAPAFVHIFPGIRDVAMLDSHTVLLRIDNNQLNDELWKSDGTEAGTVLLGRFGANTSIRPDPRLVKAGGSVYFAASSRTQTGDVELWKTDGTVAGTIRVKDINPGETNASAPIGLTPWGDRVFFSATDPAAGRELWVSDGTDAGTHRVKDVNPGPSDGVATFNPGALWGAIGDRFYFTADDGTHGTELWSTDGTEGGTTMLHDTAPGDRGSGRPLPRRRAGPRRVLRRRRPSRHRAVGDRPWRHAARGGRGAPRLLQPQPFRRQRHSARSCRQRGDRHR